ncbi:MAG: hypothetical protein A3C02_02870 [Candidatus Andersenbacteria bacterium RIFCSPHIGHO2_02_FULL_45_11]|uniref:DUF1653 domain-containing protein n=1 Tax=Candidatus Andersenbacteria bacterium RIFCSPHIGHO2_12_FULL_45_11 TaxID=1797281 RepID=A0A1G1X3D8_9BACT|nr:MAG: hypothetical protein A2805_02895 [Candidatus Andersenbacteria bacterium RIFCSPHIGHO2_01_FULL_46_36]OGY32123.1 MAG: hypothetical protein A3C02_02870 [Candidatus Andersenbacteria bacterium RIFCSPHIGHO2_02_FULL_45_11]OGY34321.1 MAG: hypothetical protein A3D99_04630 [Candidatus Andersenbacteria bacterium RIFCSPHIGHO2_12_FULL_45_11]
MASDDAIKDQAQQALANLPVRAGDWFVHYKGGKYEVAALALKEDTLEPLVIYRSPQHGNTVWARSYSEWNSEVEWEGKTVQRFVKTTL